MGFACGDSDNTEQNFYNNWVETGPGLSKDVEKNVLTEFVGSTKCPYCPLSDSLLVSYFNPDHQNYVGSDVTKKWFIINYHTYHPSAGDPLYEFLRGGTAEEDFCYIRFGEGGQGEWYNVGGVPTVLPMVNTPQLVRICILIKWTKKLLYLLILRVHQ